MSRLRVRVYAGIAGVFLLGAVCGGAASYGYAQREQRGLVAGERDAFERRRLGGLSRQLDLTDEQRESLKAIFRDERAIRRQLTRDAFERCGEPMREHRQKIDARIRAVLTPEQQQRFDELRRGHRGQRFDGPPHRRRPLH